MVKYNHSITILGCFGGVAKSILSILNKSAIDENDPINPIIKNTMIHLIDKENRSIVTYDTLFPNIKEQMVFHQFDLNNIKLLTEHLITTNTKVVIDVSWADSVDMLQCCNNLGIKYVNTALENPMIDENEDLYAGFGLIERIKILEKYKDDIQSTTAIICSGMNPGVVQWMAIELLKEETSEDQPIGLYIVEQDTSFFNNKKDAKKDVLYTTWSPECFLDEAILSYPMFMSQHTPLFLYENVYDIEFKVTLGDKQFYGCLMPHEEVYSLGKLLNIESGFLYKVNNHTTELIRSNIEDVDVLWDYEMKVLDPNDSMLDGEDMCGVLFVYKDKERYMYNVLSNEEIFAKYKTNATYFQVACGIYASLAVLLLDDIPKGTYYVEELLLNTDNYFGKYLRHYMTDFVIGENDKSDGLLLDRIRKFQS